MRTLPSPAPVGQQRTPAGWATDVAEDMRVQPATVESWIHGDRPLQECLARVIRALTQRNEVGLLAKIEVAIDAARATLPIPPLDDELIEQAVCADEEEAMARDRFLMHRSQATMRRWRIALEAQRGTGFLLLLAVQQEERAQVPA